MFKLLVLVMLMLLDVAKDVCGQADFMLPVEPTMYPPPEITAPSINDVKSQLAKETNEKYHFEASQQFFYVGAFPWKRAPDLAKNLRYDYTQIAAGYIVTDGIGAHKLHLSNATWNEARQTCIKEGGHLAIIRSHAEEKIVLQMMADKSITEAWVGYHNKFQEGEWVSVLDEPFQDISRARWSTEFTPNPSGDSTECAQLLTDGGLDDYDCEHEQKFICKIPI